jgi:hypothetical protein
MTGIALVELCVCISKLVLVGNHTCVHQMGNAWG